MLYYLFSFLEKNYSVPGAGVFQYITFRMAMAVITSLIITTVYGRRLIDYLVSRQVEAALTAEGKGYLPVRPDSPRPKFISHDSPPRSMKVSYAKIYEQLETSSRWTREHFHP